MKEFTGNNKPLLFKNKLGFLIEDRSLLRLIVSVLCSSNVFPCERKEMSRNGWAGTKSKEVKRSIWRERKESLISFEHVSDLSYQIRRKINF